MQHFANVLDLCREIFEMTFAINLVLYTSPNELENKLKKVLHMKYKIEVSAAVIVVQSTAGSEQTTCQTTTIGKQ